MRRFQILGTDMIPRNTRRSGRQRPAVADQANRYDSG